MPKQTFFNLQEEKREAIIEAAIEEFALKDFRSASLSHIVERLKIAKGSMYQYFDNKRELYVYLVGVVSQKKLEFLNARIKHEQSGFFDLYKDIIFTAAKFDLMHPVYSTFLYNVGQDSTNAVLSKDIMDASIKYIYSILKLSKESKEIREDVDLNMAAFIISYLSVDIGVYLAQKYKFSYLEILKKQDKVLPITDEQLSEELDKLINFYRKGIGS